MDICAETQGEAKLDAPDCPTLSLLFGCVREALLEDPCRRLLTCGHQQAWHLLQEPGTQHPQEPRATRTQCECLLPGKAQKEDLSQPQGWVGWGLEGAGLMGTVPARLMPWAPNAPCSQLKAKEHFSLCWNGLGTPRNQPCREASNPFCYQQTSVAHVPPPWWTMTKVTLPLGLSHPLAGAWAHCRRLPW